MRRAAAPAALAVLVLVAACASAPLRKAAILSEELAKATLRVQATVEEQYAAGNIAKDRRDAFEQAFLKMAKAGKALNAAIRAADGAAVYDQAGALVGFVRRLIDEEVVRLPEPARTYVGLALEGLRSTLLTLMALSAGGA